MKAMLAKPTNDPSKFIKDDDYIAEEKLDGQRFIVKVVDSEAKAYSRKGDEMVMPTYLADQFDHLAFSGTWVFDGELMDDMYFVFDLVQLRSTDLSSQKWLLRNGALQSLFSLWKPNPSIITHVQHFEDEFNKEVLLERMHSELLEGVVFKRKDSRYISGKSNNWIKFKITETCDAVVLELDRKNKEQAVTMGLYHEGELIEVGGLKIPSYCVGNIALGDVLEVRYVYSTNNKKLCQPVFVRVRHDKNPIECTTQQLER